ncbi:MAG TPA: hypothetical protein VJJ21_01465 [Candidatus Nanoarchaeia archaeon]|nr:hypothetical protein [Candidatus Nanoarchaeia archaeon]
MPKTKQETRIKIAYSRFLTDGEWERVTKDEQELTALKTPPKGYIIKELRIYPTGSGQIEHYILTYFDAQNQPMQSSSFQVETEEGKREITHLEDLV